MQNVHDCYAYDGTSVGIDQLLEYTKFPEFPDSVRCHWYCPTSFLESIVSSEYEVFSERFFDTPEGTLLDRNIWLRHRIYDSKTEWNIKIGTIPLVVSDTQLLHFREITRPSLAEIFQHFQRELYDVRIDQIKRVCASYETLRYDLSSTFSKPPGECWLDISWGVAIPNYYYAVLSCKTVAVIRMLAKMPGQKFISAPSKVFPMIYPKCEKYLNQAKIADGLLGKVDDLEKLRSLIDMLESGDEIVDC